MFLPDINWKYPFQIVFCVCVCMSHMLIILHQQMGMINSCHKFFNMVSRLMTSLDLTMKVDNCVIGGKNIEEVVTIFNEFFNRCRMHNIKLTRRKSIR